MIRHKQNRIGTYKRCKVYDFSQISQKAWDVIATIRNYYSVLASKQKRPFRAKRKDTQYGYKQTIYEKCVNKMSLIPTTDLSEQELREQIKARNKFRQTLTTAERTFLTRPKRFVPDEAEALIYQMPEEVEQAREAFNPSDGLEWGNPADLHYVRKDGQLRGINVSTDITNDLNDYGGMIDEIAPDRRKYNALNYSNPDDYVRIPNATPYFRKLERYMRGVFYLVHAPKPNTTTANRALWFIWKYHRHNIANYAQMSLDTAHIKDAQINNTGKDNLQRVSYYVRLQKLARACLSILDVWAYESGNASKIPPTFTDDKHREPSQQTFTKKPKNRICLSDSSTKIEDKIASLYVKRE